MNPPTDTGKKNLPPSLKSRFTGFYIDELIDPEDLKIVVKSYIGSSILNPPVDEIVQFYLESKKWFK